jgi:hypothetical protein
MKRKTMRTRSSIRSGLLGRMSEPVMEVSGGLRGIGDGDADRERRKNGDSPPLHDAAPASPSIGMTGHDVDRYLSEAVPTRPLPSDRNDDISRLADPRPPPSSRRSPPGGTRPTSRSRPSAGGRGGLGRGRQRRWTIAHPSESIVAESRSDGASIVCMQSVLLDPRNPKFFHTASLLSGCTRFATSEMHLCRNEGSSQTAESQLDTSS